MTKPPRQMVGDAAMKNLRHIQESGTIELFAMLVRYKDKDGEMRMACNVGSEGTVLMSELRVLFGMALAWLPHHDLVVDDETPS